MPVILGKETERLWLDSHAGTDALHALLVPYPDGRMEAFPVGKWVGDPRHEGPRCVESEASGWSSP
jgi:putative SOS response-associated peptidase YedK